MTDDVKGLGNVRGNEASARRWFFGVEAVGDGGGSGEEGGDGGVEFGESVLRGRSFEGGGDVRQEETFEDF